MSGDIHPSGGNHGGEGDVARASDTDDTAQGLNDSDSDEDYVSATEHGFDSDESFASAKDDVKSPSQALSFHESSDEVCMDPLRNPGYGGSISTQAVANLGGQLDSEKSSDDVQKQQMVSPRKPGYGFLLIRIKHGRRDLYIMHVQVPLLCTSKTIDWIGITDHEVTYEHIRCCKLKPNAEISDIVTPLENTGIVKCLVLINHKSSYNLEQSFSHNHQCAFPILVAKFDGGTELLTLITNFGRDIEAKVELFPTEERYLQQRTERKEEKSGFFPKFFTNLFNSKPEQHDRVATLLFPKEGPRIVSQDAQFFQMVMKEFGYYETEESKEKPDQTLMLMADRCHETIHQDFPFYIALMYRICVIKEDCYHRDALQRFKQTCLQEVEKLNHLDVAASLLEFISRDDFDISLDLTTQTGHSVFLFLRDSMKVFMTDRKDIQPRFIYRTVLWITLYLRLCVSMPFWEVDTGIWNDNFMKDADAYKLDEKNIEGLKNAVELIQCIKLPSECNWNASLVSVFMTSAGYCQFPTFVKVIETCEMVFDSQEDFLEYIIVLPRTQHLDYRSRNEQGAMNAINIAQHRTPLGGAVKEGLQFLNTLLDVVTRKKWKMEQFDEEVKQWLVLLLEYITHRELLCSIKTLLFSEGMVSSRYQAFIIKKITENTTTRDLVKLQDVSTFLELCLSTVQHWPVEFLEDYLNGLSTKIPAYKPIQLGHSGEWKIFLDKMTERFQHASQQKIICNVLLWIAQHYRGHNRAYLFMPDMMRLDIPRLLCASSEKYSSEDQQIVEEFKHDLHIFFCTRVTRETVLWSTNQTMNFITENRTDHFQEAVLEVALKVIVPDLNYLQDPPNQYMKRLLESAVNSLKSDTTCRWVQKKLSLRHRFCLDILNMCCKRITPLACDMLDWVKSCKSILELISSPFVHYLEVQQVVFCGDIPEEGASNPSVQQYFKWFQKHYQLLLEWKGNLNDEDANYDNIYWYTHNYQEIGTLAQAISTGHLLVTEEKLSDVKQRIEQTFLQLNRVLIRCIPSNRSAGWCSLVATFDDHGIEIPEGVRSMLHSYIAFPDEKEKAATIDVLLHAPPTDKSSTSVQLRMSKELKLTEQCRLIRELHDFLKPISDLGLNVLVYFRLCPSKLFSIYLRHSVELVSASESAGITPLVFNQALQRTQTLLMNLLSGTATYNEMTAEGSLLSDLEKISVEEEFRKLIECPSFRTHRDIHKRITKIQNLLKLIQSESYIRRIQSVCQQYGLTNCLQDSQLIQLVQVADDLSNQTERSKLTPLNAQPKWEKVCTTLCLKDGNIKCLDLFSKVEVNTDFYNFLKEKRFTGSKGETRFYQQLRLVTAQLQHQNHSEVVLNHLYAAFRFIAPFMDPSQDFHSFMAAIAALEVPSGGLQELETVENNMHFIRYWFSGAEDTLENVASELKCILTTGFYEISPLSASGRNVKLLLQYESSSSISAGSAHLLSRQQSLDFADDHDRVVSAEQPPTEIQITLTTDQIDDLVHKLGFLDSNGDEETNIHRFQHLNEIAYRLLELIYELKELGHPNYSDTDYKFVLRCSVPLHEADREVEMTEEVHRKWIDEVDRLHSMYKWLLFFNVPKLLNLHRLLKDHDPCADKIFYEVSFLFKNDTSTRERLKKIIGCITPAEDCKEKEPVHSPSSPMDEVGSFLDKLFGEEQLSPCLLPKRCTTLHMPNVLYSSSGCSQRMLIELIFRIYNGPPEAFEIFHCSSTTTEHDLRLFVERMALHPRRYLILEVSRLPYQLQEILLKLYLHTLGSTRKTRVDFIETAPSVLREVPGLRLIEYKEYIQTTQAQEICRGIHMKISEDISCLSLVYGLPGNGKTHYIHEQLNQVDKSKQVTVTINEAFSILTAIERLCSLPRERERCAIFFNFTMLPPVESAHESEKKHYQHLIEEVGWFFLRFLVFGYIEDVATGKSFHRPGDLSWAVFIEVPSRHDMDAEGALKCFREEVPVLTFLGTPFLVDHNYDYCVDDDVQLVCKYLQAYKDRTINTLYIEGRAPVKFGNKDDLTDAECQRLLQRYMPEYVKGSKITQKVFVKYMKRRCAFLDNCPAFNYNYGEGEYDDKTKQRTDTKRLGSVLLKTMLQEVADFCDPSIKENWSIKPHQQLIYDFSKDGDGSLGLISLNPDLVAKQDVMDFRSIGVHIPSMQELYSKKVLEQYLSRALNIHVHLLDDHFTRKEYVLTLDYALKMLNIHERYECGFPVIIEGETGVGKTALVAMLAELWNQSLIVQWELSKSCIVDLMEKNIQNLPEAALEKSKRLQCVEGIHFLKSAKEVSKEVLEIISELPCNTSDDGRFSMVLNHALRELEEDPIVSLVIKTEAFATIKHPNPSCKSTADLLDIIFKAEFCRTFHKLNIHAAIQPERIYKFFDGITEQANQLQRAYDACDATRRERIRLPFVTAYLDEINTSSCLGLLKEIIVDRTVDGKLLPKNVFIIAACNPHRGNSLIVNEDYHYQTWLKGTYYVHQLHPSLELLMWDYGSLDKQQEREYVKAKMKMLDQSLKLRDIRCLTDVIVDSQERMRKYASKELQSAGLTKDKSEQYAKSCVSQRDIQRVFTFYSWLMKVYKKLNPHKEREWRYHRRAVMVSLGIVYYMRLSTNYRNSYRQFVDDLDKAFGECTFSQALEDELNWIIEQVELPPGIAKTESLKENVFATIACTMTNTPLIIVGKPGSSKTLSFNIVITNVKGRQSRRHTFREIELFNSLDPHFYQCSRRTTSDEIEKVFERAINRQRSLSKIRLPVSCVVFMDEAGLPEEKFQSLKVLHYHLDKQEVAFVAISNYVLDAAKTNRAVSLFRPSATRRELSALAHGCIGARLKSNSELSKTLLAFCQAYMDIQKHQEFKQFFGLRDFIHFLIHLRRKQEQKRQLTSSLIVEALERNFNGSEKFKTICDLFLKKAQDFLHDLTDPQFRNTIDILKESLADHNNLEGNEIHSSIQSEVRYKLIIDPSEDDSLVRLLFACGVLQKENTRLYICSDFPGDSQLRVNTIAQIRHSIEAGHTVLMCQTDEIHESFYDVFNQHFHTIEDPERGARFYTNIAIGAHSKPCRVDPKFQCIIVIKQSDVKHTPPPFLNRFEKYYLTHASILETVLKTLPMNIRAMMVAAQSKVAKFVQCVEKRSFYGYSKETIESLVLSVLPSRDHICRKVQHLPLPFEDARVCILVKILDKLCSTSGFHIHLPSSEEMKLDAEHIFTIVLEAHPEFQEALKNIKSENVEDIVEEAHYILHESQGPTTIYQTSIESCMVISVLMQWLVGYLCKSLMQVMTPEAIAIHCNKIPTPYLRTYLRNHEHFSLKNLVEQYLQRLQNQFETNGYTNPTKLLLLTRSSPLIYQLPIVYPTTENKVDEDDLVERYVCTSLKHLMLCKVSLGYSQSKLQKLLSEFVSSDLLSLLVLIMNMHNISKKMVNHLRIMIEEAEWQSKKQGKLFVLLLHFPSAMFFSACYPTIFLKGWDHYYLDTIACATETEDAVVDIKNWFCSCCGITSQKSESEMVAAVENVLLREVIPVLAAKVSFETQTATSTRHEATSTTHDLNVSDTTELIETLLIETELGTLLSANFCTYWKPRTMAEQLQRVSKFMYDQESTLNITDSIQTIMQSAFFDYIVVMFRIMIKNHVIDMLINSDSPKLVKKLIFAFLRAFPMPSLAKLRVIGTNQRCSPDAAATYFPKFPFFKYICEILENAVDESRQEVNERCGVLTDAIDVNITTMYNEAVVSILKSKHLDKEIKTCLVVAIEAIDEDDENKNVLWHAYQQDFVHFMLHLEKSSLTKPILQPYIEISEDDVCALSRLVDLHVHLRLHKLDLTKVERILKPISKIQTDTSLVPSSTLAALVVDVLFSYISRIEVGEFQQWYGSYRSVICIPGMMEDILTNLTADIEARLNIMHATYLMAQCCCDPVRGLNNFNTLKTQYFGRNPEVPHLRGIMNAEMKILRTFPPEKTGTVKVLTEKLLAFFFSNYNGHVRFNEDDVEYFLECVNHIQSGQSVSDCITEGNLLPEDPSYNCISSISICQQKLFLSRILGDSEYDMNPQSEGTGLGLHDRKNRKVVGEVLTVQSLLGCPGPYIPKFYQQGGKVHIPEYEASQNELMQQQPLAHLYFETVLEHLQDRKYGTPHLIKFADCHTETLADDSTTDSEKMLLFIEKQAIIQVLIQQSSVIINPNKRDELHDFFSDESGDPVNKLLHDESMGGGTATTVSGHGLVLAMYLQRQLNSPTQMLQLLSDDQKMHLTCMKPLQQLITHQPKTDVHLFPFIGPEKSTSDLGKFYQDICDSMEAIFKTHGKNGSVANLCQIAHQSTSDCKITLSATTSICKKSAFRMLLWLCAYYEFFDKKRYSKHLASAISGGMKSFLEPSFIDLLKSFLYPGSKQKMNMVYIPETPSAMVQQQLGRDAADPVFQLFRPAANTIPDQNDTQLRHAMANMVAVVLASPPRSNHLWYHMFAADGLHQTYMTGYLYSQTVCTGGYCYDCGTELSESGGYGRSQYEPRNTLSLSSYYLVLWANFSAFCIALLTQRDAQEKIKPLFSSWQPLRHYCVARARSVWLHLSTCLDITPDERSFLVMKCMLNLLEVSINNPQLFNKGIFNSTEELKICEAAWHDHVYVPSIENIHGQFSDYCKLMEVALLKDLSAIEAHYPHYPSTDELFHILMSSRAITNTQTNELYVLSKFALEYPRLLAAGDLLPDLLEFYQWIHTELAFLVTYKYAQNRTIKEVIAAVDGKHPKLKRHELFERVKDGYNLYVDEIGGWIDAGPCQHEGIIRHIGWNTTFLHLLSDSDEEEGNDWLYVVIAHIIKLHNSFLRNVFKSVAERPELSSLRILFSEHLEEYVCPNEVLVNRGAMITCTKQRITPGKTHRIGKLLQLIRSRYLYPSEQTQKAYPFDLYQLQNDVVEAFIVGKPLISESKEQIRIRFEFKKEATHLFGTVIDISSITDHIKIDSGYRKSILPTKKSQLEHEFHAADYNTVLEVVKGLKNACEHLIGKICPSHNSGATTVQPKDNIFEFLLIFYPGKTEEDIMECVGMKHLTPTQKSCLCSIELPYMCSTLEFFVKWIQDGMYNFCRLPQFMKMHISTADQEALTRIPEVYRGSPAVLHKELQELLEVLTKSESYLCANMMKYMKTPIIDFLTDSDVYGTEGEQLAQLIPRTVLCQHYVPLRVLLRQLAQGGVKGLNKQEPWSEFVSDLWEERNLKHIKDSAKTYTTGIRNVATGTTTTTPINAEYSDSEDEDLFTGTENDDCKEQMQHTAPTGSTLQDIQHDQILETVAGSLTTEDIQQLLKKWNLPPDVVKTFTNRQIDGTLLLQCTQDHLTGIGVTNPFDSLTIYTKFRQHLKTLKPKLESQV